MSIDHEISVVSHPNIYTMENRKLKIYLSFPEVGVTERTGLMLFISGYGSNANSNVYKKMRREFSDQYDLITIQCDFFGWEHMQLVDLQEDLNSFNDMSLMQVLDNLNAVYTVIEILKQNETSFNSNRIICQGHSHGGYLAYFCNRVAPQLFSLIIDNSAYLEPIFAKGNHSVPPKNFNKRYLVRDMLVDDELMNMEYIYNNFENRANIVSFHGVYDQLYSISPKLNFCNKVKNCLLNVVNNDLTLYKGMFNTPLHGFQTDFLKFTEFVLNNYPSEKKDNSIEYLEKQTIKTSQQHITFQMIDGLLSLQA